jgi:AcrR family transcriptional regulator
MREKAEYRNALRSRALIRKAFVELMHENDFGRISVTDIVARADINRGTFYAHYRDTADVLGQIENDLVSKMQSLIDECNAKDLVRDPLPILKELNGILSEDLEFYRLLITASGSGGFQRKLRAVFVDKMMADPRTKSRYRNREKFHISLTLFAGGIMAIYEAWFAGEIDKSLDEIAAIICESNPYRER